MVSKNNPARRAKAQQKLYNDKPIKPVLYVGSHVGHGRYIAAQDEGSGELVRDKQGKPIPFRQL